MRRTPREKALFRVLVQEGSRLRRLRRFAPKGGTRIRPFTYRLVRVPKGESFDWIKGNEFDSCLQGVPALNMYVIPESIRRKDLGYKGSS